MLDIQIVNLITLSVIGNGYNEYWLSGLVVVRVIRKMDWEIERLCLYPVFHEGIPRNMARIHLSSTFFWTVNQGNRGQDPERSETGWRRTQPKGALLSWPYPMDNKDLFLVGNHGEYPWGLLTRDTNKDSLTPHRLTLTAENICVIFFRGHPGK